MEHLPALSKELGYPAASKLYDAALRAGYNVSPKQVQTFVAAQNVRQVFHKLPRSEGKITAPTIDDTWVADLVDYTARPSESESSSGEGQFQYIFIVQDVFSRRLMAEPTRDKLPATCKAALESIIHRRGTKPKVLSTDLGLEFKGAFDAYLEQEGIFHRLKDPRSLNAQGALDAAIRTLRPMLSRIQAEENTRNWASELQRAVKAYNHLVHGHLHGRSPSEVEGDGNLQFALEKQSAIDTQHNSNLVNKRDTKVMVAGHFRDELQPRKFHRVHQANYSDEVHAVKSVFNGHIVDTHGDAHRARHVLAVPAGSGHLNTEGLRGGSEQTDRLRLQTLEPYKERIANFLGNQGKFEFEVANYMKEIGMEALMVQGLSYRKALRLLGFTVHGNARGSGKQLVTRTGPVHAAPKRPELTPAQAAAALAAPAVQRRPPPAAPAAPQDEFLSVVSSGGAAPEKRRKLRLVRVPMV